MRDYRITIRLLSQLGTPWQSDTVFGHLAWHVAHGASDMSIEDFLRPFCEGRPPFVLSDGFPGGLLPRPFLPVPTVAARTPAEYTAARTRQKALFVSCEDFDAIRCGDTSNWTPQPQPWTRFETPHASLNRFTEATVGPGGEAEGGNFFITDMLTPTTGDTVSIYLRADAEWAQRVLAMLEQMAPLGFGRDRSTGAGAYEVADCCPWDDFGPLDGANGFVSLSSYCPAENDPTAGRWRIRLKYGKLGENAGDGNPFKRPLMQLEPGAVFLTDDPQPFYGRAVGDVAPAMPEAIQNCYTLAVPCVIASDVGVELRA